MFISSLSISFQQPGSFHLSRRTRLLERTQVDTARAFVATRADLSPSLFFSFSANQPSSAGYIWGTNNKIKKKRNGIKENITGGGNICRPPFPIQSNENCWMCRPSPAYHVATYRFSFTTDEVFQSADIPAATPSRRPHPSKKETKIYYSGRRTEFFPPPAFFFFTMKMSG